MTTIKKFEDLEIWQEARRLSNEIKEIVLNSELKSDFRLRDQIKGSLGSVMDNIAGGFERDGNSNLDSFYLHRKVQQEHQDLNYIEVEKLDKLVNEYEQLSKRIANFITYLNKQDFKGNKFKLMLKRNQLETRNKRNLKLTEWN